MNTRRIFLAVALAGLGGCSDLAVYQGVDSAPEAAPDVAHADDGAETSLVVDVVDVVASDVADVTPVVDVAVDAPVDVPTVDDSGYCTAMGVSCGFGATCPTTARGQACCGTSDSPTCDETHCPSTGGPYPYFCAPEVGPSACCWIP